MPLTPVKYEDMVSLFEESLDCVVAITQIAQVEGVSKLKKSNVGFIVDCSDKFTVIAVDSSFEFETEEVVVKFSNGTEGADTHFIKLSGPINLVAVRIPRGNWKAITYGEIKKSSEVVLSIAFLFGKMLPFVSCIISPRSTCVNANGDVIQGTEETFSFNLPVGGQMSATVTPSEYETTVMLKKQILGSPVFNTDGHFVGFLNRSGSSFDFKFGVRAEYIQLVLDKWLAKREWKDAIQSGINAVQKSMQDPKRLKRN